MTEVARRYGVVRRTVHEWCAVGGFYGLAGLADRSSRPQTGPHQMPAEIEVRIVELRRAHPSWGPRTIGYHLSKEGIGPVPSRSAIYRSLVRHRLLDPEARRKRRSDYKRWKRGRAMELWQMDVMGGVQLSDGSLFSDCESLLPSGHLPLPDGDNGLAGSDQGLPLTDQRPDTVKILVNQRGQLVVKKDRQCPTHRDTDRFAVPAPRR